MDLRFDSMEKLILFALFAINILFFYLYVKDAKRIGFWFLPSSLILFTYFMNYILKPILLLKPPIEANKILIYFPYTTQDFIFALFYSTLFFINFVCGCIFFNRKLPRNISTIFTYNVAKNIDIEKFNNILSVSSILSYLYLLNTEGIYGFNTGYQRGFWDIILSISASFAYPCFFISLLLFKLNRHKSQILVLIGLVSILLIDSVFSTSKAPILLLLFLYLLYADIVKIKINKWVIVAVAPLILFMFFYSYYSRYYSDTSTISLDLVTNNLGQLSNNLDLFYNLVFPSMFNRFELFDNLIYTTLRVDVIDKGYFTYGSIVELFNLIPRFLWTSRPYVYFDYFVGIDILGNYSSSASAGRIGEAYFVFGRLGFLMGIPYAYISYLGIKILRGKLTIAKVFFFAFLYIHYFAHDDYLFQATNSIFFALIIFYTVLWSYQFFQIFFKRV